MVFSSLLFLVTFVVTLLNSCVIPNGLDDTNINSINLPENEIFSTFVPLMDVSPFEGPIAVRLANLFFLELYNSMAPYQTSAIDSFGRLEESENRRRCTIDDSELFELHRQVTLAYTLYYSILFTFPEQMTELNNLMNTYGLDISVCDTTTNCEDISLPWSLAFTVVTEMLSFGDRDGYNHDGSLSREFFRIPYQDWREDIYIPENNPWVLRKEDNWQPLLESDNKGFLYNQEHVTPHVGFTGKSYFLGNQYICSLEAEDPKYDYDLEIELLLERLRNLTDEQKVLIEFFDNKLNSLTPLHNQFLVKLGITGDSYEYFLSNAMWHNAIYEATLIAWKEKVNYNMIRPPSIIHHRLEGELITTYAGTDTNGNTFGTQTYLADDWEAYIRTMPHTEYPSGSACQCITFAGAMLQFYGSDDIPSIINEPLTQTVLAFSSFIEPLSTPAEDVTLTFSSFNEISNICGQSRLDGGMHFITSVTASQELCADVGTIIANSFQQLSDGILPDYTANIDDLEVFEDRCEDVSSISTATTVSDTGSGSGSGSGSSD